MMDFLNETSYLESIYLAFIIVALAVSVFQIRKESDYKKNAKNYFLSFIIHLLVLLIVWFMKNVIFKFANIPNDPILNFWVVIVIPLIFLIAYIFVCCDVKMIFRNIIASLCIIIVIFISNYPSLLAYKDYKMFEYVLDGSYSISNNEDSIEAEFRDDDKILRIGQKDSGKCLDGFNVNLYESAKLDISLSYRAHIQNIGWYDWSSEGTNITYENDYSIDSVQFMLYGKDAFKFDIEYRIAFIGEDWQEWITNGRLAGVVDDYRSIEAIEIRLVPTGNDVDNEWTVTQYSAYSYDQSMFYTILNNDTGALLVVDGGGEVFGQAYAIINLLGGHVDGWFVTRPDYEHSVGYSIISENDYGIDIDNVYDMSNCCDSSFEIDGLRVEFFDASVEYEDNENYGSLMFKLSGNEDSFLFCSDAYCLMDEDLLERYGEDSLSAEYIEIGNVGASFIDATRYANLNPSMLFLDFPSWMMQNGDYAVDDFITCCGEHNIVIYTQGSAPNRVPLD